MAPRIMGIDPGTLSMGYGVVEAEGDSLKLVACGALTVPQRLPLAQRLLRLHQGLRDVMQRYHPDEVAIEEPFMADNARSALAVGRAQAIAILAAAQQGLPVFRYSPTQVKQAVTSYGASSKEQVQEMVRLHLGQEKLPSPSDATDALAVALCHQRQAHLASLIKAEDS